MSVRIENVTEAQAIAIESLLATWMSLGRMGGSRWTAFYADGDGNFRPRIEVDGHEARHTDLIPAKGGYWKGDEYRIDFDIVSRLLREREEYRT